MFKKINTIIIILLVCFTSFKGQEIKISKLEINQKLSSEISPVVHDSALYFVSNRKSKILINIFNQDNEHLYKVYQTPLHHDGKTGNISLFQPEKDFNLTAGSIAFSPDNQFHIATFNKTSSYKNIRSKLKNKTNLLGLYESRRINSNKWGQYTQIPFSVNNNFSFAQPTISPDGQTLVFVSDKDGGSGQTDLYYSQLTPSGWSEPINLGTKINSPEKEIFPFYHSSGKLYFSSNRSGGLGGFDIYYSINNNGEWSNPVLLQEPINSPYDDFSCYIFPDETSGFFSSTREKNDNIYRFDYVIQFCENPEEVQEEEYCFTFFEERAVEADTIPVKYLWKFGDGKEVYGVEVDHCFPGPGEYEISLSVIDAETGEFLYDVANYEVELERPQQVYFYLPEKVNAGATVTMEAKLTGFGDVENVKYFWAIIDDGTIFGETISYNFRKKGIYNIRCEAYWGNNQSICSQRTIIVE